MEPLLLLSKKNGRESELTYGGGQMVVSLCWSVLRRKGRKEENVFKQNSLTTKHDFLFSFSGCSIYPEEAHVEMQGLTAEGFKPSLIT